MGENGHATDEKNRVGSEASSEKISKERLVHFGKGEQVF
jgi:hypothetical protein